MGAIAGPPITLALAFAASAYIALGAQRPVRPPDVYFTPTKQAVADAMLALARVTASDVVYDLGSGDGRIVILAAQKYGARGVGIEIDPALVTRSREIAREGGVEPSVRFVEGDFFKEDLAGATVVTLYLSASLNADLEPRLRALRPGTRIVSHQFPIGRWAPDETRQADGATLYRWVVP